MILYLANYNFSHSECNRIACADPEGWGDKGSGPPLKNIGFLSNTGPDPLKNHKATEPEFNVGPSSARQGNDICWRANDGQLIVVFGSSPLINQKILIKIVVVGPPLTKLSGSAHDLLYLVNTIISKKCLTN